MEVKCHPNSREHAEMRTRDRVLGAARAFQEDLSFSGAKNKVLEAMHKCDLMGYMEIDRESGLPKYKIRTKLPGSTNITLILYIIVDKEKKVRMLKSVYTNR
jgi:hypothetical protein